MSDAADFFKNELAANPNAGTPSFDNEAIPEGKYALVIESCAKRKYVDGVKRKPEDIAAACSSDPTLVCGDEIAITYGIIEGEYAKKKKLFGSYTIVAASNQKTYGEFTPEKRVVSSKNDLCGLMKRVGAPKEWSDWEGRMFWAYVTRKVDGKGVARNNVVLVVKPDEVIVPYVKPEANTTPVKTDEPPF